MPNLGRGSAAGVRRCGWPTCRCRLSVLGRVRQTQVHAVTLEPQQTVNATKSIAQDTDGRAGCEDRNARQDGHARTTPAKRARQLRTVWASTSRFPLLRCTVSCPRLRPFRSLQPPASLHRPCSLTTWWIRRCLCTASKHGTSEGAGLWCGGQRRDPRHILHLPLYRDMAYGSPRVGTQFSMDMHHFPISLSPHSGNISFSQHPT